MTRRKATTTALLVLFAAASLAAAADAIVRRPVQYDTLVPPPAGRFLADPDFGTRIFRLSDSLHQQDVSRGGSLTAIINEYATVDPFNLGATRLLLVHESYFALYLPDGTFLEDLPLSVDAVSQPRWSRRDPDLFYFLSANTLSSFRVSTGAIATVRAFPEYARIDGRGESDISEDGDHFVFIGDDREVFVYEISTDTKGPVLDTSLLGGLDQLQITAGNDVIVGWLASGTARANGVELFDRNMRFERQLAPATGHLDVGRDDAGAPILVLVDAADPLSTCRNGVVKIRLSDGATTCLAMFDPSLAVHVSAPERGGAVVVSTYAPSDPSPDSGWAAYTNEILMVRLDGSGIERLAHHRSRPLNAYTWEPRAAQSHDGRHIVFSSNFDLQRILGYPAEYSDAYEIDPGARGGRPSPRDRVGARPIPPKLYNFAGGDR